jgi:hypothetical protein
MFNFSGAAAPQLFLDPATGLVVNGQGAATTAQVPIRFQKTLRSGNR